jgi:3-methyladenine DNA glycosylase AlkD
MNKSTVAAYLKKNQDPRGIEHWKQNNRGSLKSYGIGLTFLRKYAKSIGRDAKLAKSLWNSNVHEMKIISLLIDDPKTMTVEQAETQVEELEGGYLAHVFSSCDAALTKTPFVVELADKWIKSKDTIRRRCGYGLLYEISKDKKKSAPDEAYFLAYVADIDKKRKKAPTPILMSMAGALLGIGKRTKKLNQEALKVAIAIGPITHSESCDPFDVAKHLTSDYAKQKLGL